jgi:uric acid transporter
MIPLVAPTLFRQLPHALQPLLDSGIVLAALIAVLLNPFFDGIAVEGAGRRAVTARVEHV